MLPWVVEPVRQGAVAVLDQSLCSLGRGCRLCLSQAGLQRPLRLDAGPVDPIALGRLLGALLAPGACLAPCGCHRCGAASMVRAAVWRLASAWQIRAGTLAPNRQQLGSAA